VAGHSITLLKVVRWVSGQQVKRRRLHAWVGD
jgi:hypothetical protein